METLLWILGYLVMVNLLGFILMGVDKRKAIKHSWRISEATLFLVALIGGSLGSFIGMHFFRHKTKHWYFVWGMPIIMIIQIILVGVLVIAPWVSISIM